MTDDQPENGHPLSSHFWSNAQHTEWAAKDVDDMLERGFLDDAEGFYYATGVGYGYATVFDEDGSHPILLSQVNSVVDPDCECGMCESYEINLSFGFPIEMGFQIIEMIQTTLDHYQEQHGPLNRIEFKDAD